MSRPPARGVFGRLRLSEYGWGRRAALIGAALIGSAAFAYAANFASRTALLQVVRACVLDQSTTGSPLPCLQVDVAGGVERGFAVLRPPFGEPDTILTPTRAIVGLEDPRLQAPDAPNYFALAWAERLWLAPEDGAPPADAKVALAVNSRLSRSQDQLHIHMGCLSPGFAQRLGAGALGPAPRAWFRAPDMAPGLEMWTYRTGARDWDDLEPFRLAHDLVGDPASLRRTTLAVVTRDKEFVVVALRSRPGGWYAAAEDVIDPRC